jgi:hypothetical protein
MPLLGVPGVEPFYLGESQLRSEVRRASSRALNSLTCTEAKSAVSVEVYMCLVADLPKPLLVRKRLGRDECSPAGGHLIPSLPDSRPR